MTNFQPSCPSDFNPRPREGDDSRNPDTFPAGGRFQSSSPRGGRPVNNPWYQIRHINFNPRPREGDDSRFFITFCHSLRFQSSSPRGGRRASQMQSRRGSPDFNPRPREGDDKNNSSGIWPPSNFNPRPREGDDSNINQFFSVIFMLNNQIYHCV